MSKATDTYADGYAAAKTDDWTIEKAQAAIPEDADKIDAEIAYCEERLKLLYAAKAHGPKQEFPKYVYKAIPAALPTAPVKHESKLVESEEELKKLGDGWGEKDPAAASDAKSVAKKKDA